MNKFHAKKTEYNGRIYDSKKEAHRSFELDMLEKAGEISNIEYQPPFPIVINKVKVCLYKADFKYTEKDGTVIIEDVKGYKKGSAYAMFRLKKKLVLAVYGIDILET